MGKPEKLSTISGFIILPVIYTKEATHFLYAKAHFGKKSRAQPSQSANGKGKAKESVLPEGRTLFVVNVPPDATERELVLFFKPAGTVERVVFDQAEAEAREEALNQDETDSEDDEEGWEGVEEESGMDVDTDGKRKRRGKKGKDQKPMIVPLPKAELRTLRQTGRTAYVVFLDASSLNAALAGPHKAHRWPSSSEPRGLAHYIALHAARRPAMDAIRTHAESVVSLFDWEEEAKKQKSKYKKGESIVDEDGFTLVVRGGAYGKTLGGEVGVATRRFERTGETTTSGKKKKKGKIGDGFYSFQKHEKKRQGMSRHRHVCFKSKSVQTEILVFKNLLISRRSGMKISRKSKS